MSLQHPGHGSCTDGDSSGTVCNDNSTGSLRVLHEVAVRSFDCRAFMDQ